MPYILILKSLKFIFCFFDLRNDFLFGHKIDFELLHHKKRIIFKIIYYNIQYFICKIIL